MTPAAAKKMTLTQLQSAHDATMASWNSLNTTTGGKTCPTSSRLADELTIIEHEMIRQQSRAKRKPRS